MHQGVSRRDLGRSVKDKGCSESGMKNLWNWLNPVLNI